MHRQFSTAPGHGPANVQAQLEDAFGFIPEYAHLFATARSMTSDGRIGLPVSYSWTFGS